MKFLINTLTGWEEPPRARHQLTFALARKGHEIIFVCKNKVGKFSLEISRYNDQIEVVTPFFPVGYKFRYRLPFLNEIYQKWLYSRIRKLYPDLFVINFDFTAHLIFNYFPRVNYYCNDEYIGNSKYRVAAVSYYHAKCEKVVIKKSIFCVGTSMYLVEKMRQLNSNAHYIPLGAPGSDLEMFVAEQKGTGRDVSIQSTPHSIHVGLVGFLSKRQISVEVIRRILDCGMILTFVGPAEKDFLEAISHQENLKITGPLTGNELFKVINTFDVGIAPYNMERVNKGTTPNKMWQYLSVGKPVVVSDLPNLATMDIPLKMIYKAGSVDDFIVKIYEAVQDDNSELAQKRIHFAKLNSWDKRVEDFLILVSHYNH